MVWSETRRMGGVARSCESLERAAIDDAPVSHDVLSEILVELDDHADHAHVLEMSVERCTRDSRATAIQNAIANGRDEVTQEELAASVAANDEALASLNAAITRAKAEGR